MERKIQHFSGLFGDDKFTTEEVQIHLEPLQKRSAAYAYEIAQHVHSNLTQLFFIEKGIGAIESSGQQLPFESPCIIFIPSGILHGFSFSADVDGEVLSMDAALFEHCLQGLPNILLHFQELKLLPFHEKLASFNELMGTRHRFHNELNEKRIARSKIIELLLQILIVRLYRLVLDHDALTVPSDNRTLNHYHKLLEYVRKHSTNTLTVAQCAEYLNMSMGHLNRICKELFNTTTQQLLHEQLAQKAKRLLLTTDKTIAEIAYDLEFKDPSHFSKFFKNKEGLSPRALRKKQTKFN